MTVRAGKQGRRLALACLIFAGLILTASCKGAQSVLDPAGPQSNRIDKIWWLFFYVSAAVQILVTIFLLLAIFQGRRRREKKGDAPEVEEKPNQAPDRNLERRMGITVKVAVALTVIILLGLTIASFSTGRSLSSQMPNKDAVTIEVTGHQWWWEVHYEDADASKRFTTANEIHVPVGQPVTVKLNSTDVIHSFWAPNLFGKKDLIPGHGTTLWFQADRPGLYRGQCAEFCGLQHAHMAFLIVAEPLDKYQSWVDEQRRPAREPADDSQRRGQQVFLSSRCIMCHTIQGTQAAAVVGPNLTHLASRSTIAAGTLPNTRGHLAGWVVDPQGPKPGNQMPPNSLSSDDLMALLDYLESLK